MNVQNASLRRREGRAVPQRSYAGLHVRVRQLLRDRGAARRAADRAEFAATGQLRSLRRAIVRLALYGATVDQSALLALSNPAHREAFGPVPEDRQGADPHGAGRTRGKRPGDRATAVEPDPHPRGKTHVHDRASYHHDRRRRRDARRHGRPHGAGDRLDAGRISLQCRWGNAHRRAGRPAAIQYRVRCDRDRARRDLPDPTRRHFPGRTHRWAGARLCLRELWGRLPVARSRPDRRQLPRQCARFPYAGR